MNSILFSIKSFCLKKIAPFILKTRKIDLSDNSILDVLNVSSSEFTYLIHTSFNVAFLDASTFDGYFRECRRHLKITDYLRNVFKDFFVLFIRMSEDECEPLINELFSYFKIKRNLKKFIKMGVKNDSNSPVARFFKNPKDSRIIGIPENHSMLLDEYLVQLIQFTWGELYNYELNKNLSIDEYQCFSSNRQIATYELALLLGVRELIPRTRYIKIVIDNKIVKYGTLMDKSPGISPENITIDRMSIITPKLQRAFSRLYIFDLICRQTDHRAGHDGNYNIVFDNSGNAISLSAFDNDNPTTFLPSSRITFGTSSKTTPYVKNGIINPKYFCADLYSKISKINKKDLCLSLNNYLTTIQIIFVIKRMKKIESIVRNGCKINRVILLNQSAWTEKTIMEEINMCEEQSLVTYLYSFIKELY